MSEKEIKILLTKIGIRPFYKGFSYLAYIIMLALNQNGCIKLKNLYKSASKHFNTNEVLIHQNIQNLINVYRTIEDKKKLEDLIGHKVYEKITIKELIYIITDFIDRQIR